MLGEKITRNYTSISYNNNDNNNDVNNNNKEEEEEVIEGTKIKDQRRIKDQWFALLRE